MYINSSTDNPLGWKPWIGKLQPGGLRGFPNFAELRTAKVLLDRDAGNPGYPPGSLKTGGAPIPQVYYAPDVLLQSTWRARGLGAAPPPTLALPMWLPAIWGNQIRHDMHPLPPIPKPGNVAPPAVPPAAVPSETALEDIAADGGASVAVTTPSGGSITLPVDTSAAAPGIFDSALAWLQSDSIVTGLSNYWIAGGAAAALFYFKSKKRR